MTAPAAPAAPAAARIHRATPGLDDDVVRDLCEEYQVVQAEQLGRSLAELQPESGPEWTDPVGSYRRGPGALLLARVDGRAVGMTGVVRWSPGVVRPFPAPPATLRLPCPPAS